jgi:hypothetical protein
MRHNPLRPNAPGGTRTPNLLIRSQMLYPIELRAPKLNIQPTSRPDPIARNVARSVLVLRVSGTRLELVTSTMSTWRSNQLS